VALEDGRWFAAEAPRDPKAVLAGRLEALGPVFSDDPLLLELEREGKVLRTRLDGRPAWCDRRLLARIHRYTLDRLRSEIEPATTSQFRQFLACWQHADEEYRLEGPRGAAEVLRQLAGFAVPAAAWESAVLPARVRDFRHEWLDELTLLGEAAWGRLWGEGASPIRTTPICLFPREDWDAWIELAGPSRAAVLSGPAHDVHAALSSRGPMFPQEIERAARLVPAHLEMGLAELVALGLLTCDSFSGLRQLLTPPSKRRARIRPVGRWSLFRQRLPLDERAALSSDRVAPSNERGALSSDRESQFQGRSAAPSRSLGSGTPRPSPSDALVEFAARQLLRRSGVALRQLLIRERWPVAWHRLVRVLRHMELRGDVRGGRFVAGLSGEQFALPEAVDLLRKVRRGGERPSPTLHPTDPLRFDGLLAPEQMAAARRSAAG
jgi:ATP-dependent Lhr-like helicase